ncbi:MAG: hypothetical protein IJQ67_03245 [Bacilli bacterium]|nr:hypothetical protein [Bacilli bacterium]
MKKYIIYTLKRYVPLYAVTFAIFISLLFTFATSVSFQVPTEGYYYGYSVDSGILYFAIPLMLFTMILPLFANTYRYSIKSADLFYQTAKGKKSIRYVNNLVLLIMVLLCFTLAYIISIILLFIRELPILGKETSTVVTSTNPYVEVVYDNYFFNFFYYIPVYLLLVIVAILNYAISYFFVTRANNFLNSLITLVLGEGILGLGLFLPSFYIRTVLLPYDVIFYSFTPLSMSRTACVIGPITLIYTAFNQLITGYGENLWAKDLTHSFSPETDVFGLIMMIINNLIFIGMGVLGIIYFLKEKEASAEYAGKAPGRDNFQIIIFHVAFGIIGLSLYFTSVVSSAIGVFGVVTAVISLVSSSIFLAAINYVFLGLLRRNFRLNKKETLILISINVLNLIINIVSFVITMASTAD